MSCPSLGNCTAVGYSVLNTTQPATATEAAGRWGPLVLHPVGTGAPQNRQPADASRQTSPGRQGGLDELRGARPHSPGEGDLQGVSCASVGNCTAVGYAFNLGPLVLTETDGHWGPTTVLRSGVSDELVDVSCVSVGNCTAVGLTGYGSSRVAAVTETNGVWGPVVTLPVTTTYSALTGVSCTSPGNCTATGFNQYQSLLYHPIVATQVDGVWRPVTLLSSSGSPAALLSVSCTSTGNCTAAGFTGSFSDPHPAFAVEKAGIWSALEVVRNSAVGLLFGISCISQADCTATGLGAPLLAGSGPPIAVTESAGVWGSVVEIGATDGNMSGVSCTSPGNCAAVGYFSASRHSVAVALHTSPSGYRVVAADGGIFAYGGASFSGSHGGSPLHSSIVGMAATPDGKGYWLVAADGGVFAYGDAAFEGSHGGSPLNRPVAGMATTPDGKGYWLVAADGGVFAYGDAAFEGSHGGSPLNRPITGMARTPDGGGYWLVAADGGVFSYGDAAFEGSHGGSPLAEPVVGMVAAPGSGYWLVAADGGVFAYGSAVFEGSHGSAPLNEPVVGMAATPDGGGYWLVAADGGVFAYGDAPFYGSHGGTPLHQPVVGLSGA